MALISCSECGHEVSDRAESCPKCGAPIAGAVEAVAAGAPIRTIQETSKKFKIQALMSVGLVVVGFIWMASASSGSWSARSPVPGLLALIGLIWYTVNRFRIWWHHK